MAPPSMLIVRDAREDDVDKLVSFSAAMARETEGRQLDLDRLRRGTLSLLRSPQYGFFRVAELREAEVRTVVGQLMITYEWSDWRDGVFWWIQSVYVDPAWRRQGVFRRMHESVLASAKSRPDVCGVRLYVEAKNVVAQEAYRRVGLTPSSYALFEKEFSTIHGRPLEDRPDEA
jgi:GNAT superfamily N-acetyltransferase